MHFVEDIEKKIKQNKIQDILFISANKNKVAITLKSKKVILLCNHLKQLEKRFEPFSNFKRIHRSYIINANYISKIDIKGGFLKLVSSETIPIGNNYFPKKINIDTISNKLFFLDDEKK